MNIKDLEACGYYVVCGAIQKDNQIAGYMTADGPVWNEGYGHEYVIDMEPAPKKVRAKKAVDEAAPAPVAEDPLVETVDDLLSQVE